MMAQLLAAASIFPFGIEFARPEWLLLAPVMALLVWWIARRSIAGLHGRRRIALFVARLFLMLLLILTLAEPRIRRVSDDVAVVVVKDVSRSVPDMQRREAITFLESSIAGKRLGDRLGVITVARDAYVQSLPSVSPRLEILDAGDLNATDLQRAVQLATAVIPSDAAGRILLISDGNQTRGSLEAASASAGVAGVPIDVVVLEYDRSRAIRVREVTAPAWTREGDVINARVLIDAGRATTGRLTVTVNGRIIDLDPDSDRFSVVVPLDQGLNALNLPLGLGSGPVHEITATLEPDPASGVFDPTEGLSAQAVTFTSARGRVLVITDTPDVHTPLVEALRGDDIVIETRASSNAPGSLAEFVGFDAVVLANQPAHNFSQRQQEELVRYVHDAGGGLILVGGPDSFGAGGWIGSPVERIMPIVLDPPQKRIMPKGALALVIDRSGSMCGMVSGTQMNQQQIANEAAILGVRALSRLDQVTIVAFDGTHDVVVPLREVGDGEEIARRIRSIGSDGGTNLYPAIVAAGGQLVRADAGVRHIVILTDGQTSGDALDGFETVTELRRLGITVSTVAIGDGADGALLGDLAAAGGGRSYTVSSRDSVAVLPQIFIKEAQTIRRTLIWEGTPFTPIVTFSDESIRGLGSTLPSISGYVVAADREGLSTVMLRGPQDDPILAHWQHGLGRVTTFTSDAAARWNTSWIEWGSFEAFWGQQLRWTIRPSGDTLARVQVHPSVDPARVVVELMDEQGERMNFATIRGRVIHPAPDDGSAAATSDVGFTQVGPGRYEANVDAAAPGVHVLSLSYDAPSEEGRRSGSIRSAIVRRNDDEMRRPLPDSPLLWQVARLTNGRIHAIDPRGADLWFREGLVMPVASSALWQILLMVGIGLFLIDVAIRRVAIDPQKIWLAVLGLFAPAKARSIRSMPSLAAAKARAEEAMLARAMPSSHRRPTNETGGLEARQHPLQKGTAPAVLSRGSGTDLAGRVPPDGVQPPTSTTSTTPPQPPTAQSQEERMSSLLAAKRRARRE